MNRTKKASRKKYCHICRRLSIVLIACLLSGHLSYVTLATDAAFYETFSEASVTSEDDMLSLLEDTSDAANEENSLASEEEAFVETEGSGLDQHDAETNVVQDPETINIGEDAIEDVNSEDKTSDSEDLINVTDHNEIQETSVSEPGEGVTDEEVNEEGELVPISEDSEDGSGNLADVISEPDFLEYGDVFDDENEGSQNSKTENNNIQAGALEGELFQEDNTLYWWFSNNSLTITADYIPGVESFSGDVQYTEKSIPWSSVKSQAKHVYVSGEKKVKPIYLDYWFSNMKEITTIDLGGLDTSDVVSMDHTFALCQKLKKLDLSTFDTHNTTNMNGMFSNCMNITSLDLRSFDTSSVTNMKSLFFDCYRLTEVDISSFDTSNVVDMSFMFNACVALKELDLRSFDTSQVTNMKSMFAGCRALTSLDISSFDTGRVISMRELFAQCVSLQKLDVSEFDTANVIDMSYMFYGGEKIKELVLSSFNTADATDMTDMFYDCRELTMIDLSGFDTSNVESMKEMFGNCRKLQIILVGSGWELRSNISGENMFRNCAALVGGAGTVYNEMSVGVEYARIDKGADEPGYLTLSSEVKVSGVSISSDEISLFTGETLIVSAIIEPTDASNQEVTWSITDSGVGSIAEIGNESNSIEITALKPGETQLSVKTKSGGFVAKCKITVNPQQVTGIKLDVSEKSMVVGDTFRLQAVVEPANAYNKAIYWKSDNPSIASVNSNGIVSALSVGNTTISAVTEDGSFIASCLLNVSYRKVTGVKLSEHNASMKVGDVIWLTANVSPTNAYNKQLQWNSSNEQVAMVTASGRVIAKKAGDAIITVTTADGGYQDSCIITVLQQVTNISLDKTVIQLGYQETIKLTAEVSPDNAANKMVSWKSSNTSVITVSNAGTVTAVGAGAAKVIVTSNDGGATATCNVTVLLDTPILDHTDTDEQGITVYWSSIPGAKLYRVLRMENGQWMKVSDTKSTYYKDANVQDGYTYSYTVVCVSNTGQFLSEMNKEGISASYYKPVYKDGWIEETLGWRYYEDNAPVNNRWILKQDELRYVSTDGYMAVDSLVYDETDYYYVDSEGIQIRNNWVAVAADETDKKLGVEFRWYYFGADGKAYKDVDRKLIDGKYYGFDSSGKMLFGFTKNRVVINETAAPSLDADHYYGALDNGELFTGWLLYADELPGYIGDRFWFYFDWVTGRKLSNRTTKIDGDIYSFDKNGVLQEQVLVTMEKSSITLQIGESEKIQVDLTPKIATDKSLFWISNDKSVAVVDEDGTVHALRPGTATITAKTNAGGNMATCKVNVIFKDVPYTGMYYSAPVYWAAENNITMGYTDGVNAGKFGVGLNCQRRELMIFLWRHAGSPTGYGDARKMFNDLKDYGATSATNRAIAWAYKTGITKGYNDGGFHPKDPIARKDVMIMLYRLAGKPSVSGTLSFSDCQKYNKNSDTYKAILWGSKNKITNGYTSGKYKGQFGDTLECLREQIVTFLFRYDNL